MVDCPPDTADRLRSEADAAYTAVRNRSKAASWEIDAEDSAREVIQILGLSDAVGPQQVREAVLAINRECLAQTTLRPGATELLASLSGQGIRLGLISNAACAEFVDWTLDRTGVRRFLDTVVISARVGVRKPDPEIFALALADLDVGPEDAAFIGDSFRFDVVGAKTAGLFTIWFNPGGQPEPAAAARRPDAVITDLTELESVIREAGVGG